MCTILWSTLLNTEYEMLFLVSNSFNFLMSFLLANFSVETFLNHWFIVSNLTSSKLRCSVVGLQLQRHFAAVHIFRADRVPLPAGHYIASHLTEGPFQFLHHIKETTDIGQDRTCDYRPLQRSCTPTVGPPRPVRDILSWEIAYSPMIRWNILYQFKIEGFRELQGWASPTGISDIVIQGNSVGWEGRNVLGHFDCWSAPHCVKILLHYKGPRPDLSIGRRHFS